MTPPDPPPIGQLLRRYRTAAALSQEALAEQAGLSVRAVKAGAKVASSATISGAQAGIGHSLTHGGR